MALFEKINDELKKAMLNKEAQRLSVIRMIKSKILLENARGDMPDEKAEQIVQTYAKQIKDTIKIAKEIGKQDVVEESEAELIIVQEFLPEEISETEIRKIVEDVVNSIENPSMSNMGKVMGSVMSKVKGVDGNLVRKIVQEILNKA